ncbi:MAG: ribosomal protein S18-alanine N-acetyltransferase [Candidatus Coatesbacteria bacterium]|nr:MAG: ribosomal protein S18-alanine N-acetyltransferase [Candidatus Coatesbacteria bacterium]
MKFDIRPTSEEDIRAIVEIENVSFPAPWTEASFRHELTNPKAFFRVAGGENDEVLGYYDIWVYAGEGHLLNICVAPEHRRKGLGKALLENALAAAQGAGAREVYLEVRPSNNAAINLYEKYGFVRLGVRKRYYRDGEDALLYLLVMSEEE